MSAERPQRSQPYSFTEREQLYDRISYDRFTSIIGDEQTAVHRVETSSNMYGEFLFVTTSRAGEEKRVYVTFYGLGYHDYRERWIDQEWYWYEANSFPKDLEQQLTKEAAQELIRKRQEEVASYKTDEPQSSRGKLFELLADLTDEDGALTEMEDMGDFADELGDGLE